MHNSTAYQRTGVTPDAKLISACVDSLDVNKYPYLKTVGLRIGAPLELPKETGVHVALALALPIDQREAYVASVTDKYSSNDACLLLNHFETTFNPQDTKRIHAEIAAALSEFKS